MAVYLMRRAAWAVLLIWLVTVFTFVLSHVISGNPAAFMAGFGATRQEIRALTIQMGLTKPLIIQYGDYIESLLHLQLGTAAATGDAVTTDLAHYLPATVELVVGADPGRGAVRAGAAHRPGGAGGGQRPDARGTAAPPGAGRA